jgi:hypothetical protein
LDQWIHALLVAVIIHLLWKSLLVTLKTWIHALSFQSELEERLCQLILVNLKHLGSFTTQSTDSYIVLFLSVAHLNQPKYLYFLNQCLFKLCFGQRLVSLVWSILTIVSQTYWLETDTCRSNGISEAQTDLFMNAAHGPFQCFCLFFILHDVASTAGLNTNPLFWSGAVGIGVLATSTQSVVKDFVASMHLLYARPFESGDAIAVAGNAKVMTVKAISYKYTRLQAFDGETHIYPNHVIANTALQNFGSLVKRRRIFSSWQMSRSSPVESLANVKTLFQEILSSVKVGDLSPDQGSGGKDNGSGGGDTGSGGGGAKCGGDSGSGSGSGSGSDSDSSTSTTASLELFCIWLKSVEPYCYEWELGVILVNIPNFREAQHRINLAIVQGLEASHLELYKNENVCIGVKH